MSGSLIHIKKPHRSAAHRVRPPPLVDRYGVLMNAFVFYAGRFSMDKSRFVREALVMRMARRTLVRHPFVSQDGIKKPHRVRRIVWGQGLWLIVTELDERDHFLCGALDHGQSHLCP